MKQIGFLLLLAPLWLAACAHREPCGQYLPEGMAGLAGAKELGNLSGQETLFRYYRCRASQGDGEGMYRTGLAYELGIGTEINLKKAAHWYNKAGRADDGWEYNYHLNEYLPGGPSHAAHAEAQYRLGLMYLEGRGKKQDDGFAHLWFGRAAKQGHEEAKREFDKLERKPRCKEGAK